MFKLTKAMICVLILTVVCGIVLDETTNTREYIGIGTIENVGFNKLRIQGKTKLIILDTNIGGYHTNTKVINKKRGSECETHADKLVSVVNEIVPELQMDVYVIADDNGHVDNDALYEALCDIEEKEEGPAVVNMSFKTVEEPRLNRIIEKLKKKKIVLIAAAGNDNKTHVGYPSSSKEVISVCGVTDGGVLSGDSSHGNVDYAMPIKYISKEGNIYEGTSISTVLFSVAAVLIWDNNKSADNSRLASLLKSYAVNPENDSRIGRGQIILN